MTYLHASKGALYTLTLLKREDRALLSTKSQKSMIQLLLTLPMATLPYNVGPPSSKVQTTLVYYSDGPISHLYYTVYSLKLFIFLSHKVFYDYAPNPPIQRQKSFNPPRHRDIHNPKGTSTLPKHLISLL
ncbi:hypothetical protein H2248_007694 [Termitomyces sp. 'cryptogamus']|nr:hypothetical protein H2248_007694 [Termitomyces sp. 'cryptogamus']